MIPKTKLNSIKPEIVPPVSDYPTIQYYGLSKDKRYSDLPDEVQVKDKISLDMMSGITLPLSKMKNIFFNESRTTKMVLKEIEKVNKLLDEYNHLVPIYDIDSL